ncbi:ATP-grasp domain-containing protein [Weissella coleopterorum]|uniref:ATP-grasp domain-containing protein n=1 Tax=Weissella coleopterorum TaxID=2714949 RepID=A0A6G8B0T1_9LACO|nr:ATP-grasp domain-containing protein [Weissella coleopterorum]QIL50847.1 ATP-grasp domain-containing protein [Weissella coleopterorum]
MMENVLIVGGSANDFNHETESDLASYQAVSVLKEHGATVFLVDDNPYNFTIERSDITPIIADLTVESLVAIIHKYAITSVMANIGGTTGIQLIYQVVNAMGEAAPKMLGLSMDALEATQNTELLRTNLEALGEKGVKTKLATNISEAFDAAREINFPVVIRPVTSSGGTLRLNANSPEQLEEAVQTALERSPTKQVNVDQGINGYQEITLVALRDQSDHMILVGGIEDMDPVGIHTADSIALTPIQTLSDPVLQRLRRSAFNLMRGFNIIGLAEVRFAVNSETEEYVVTRLNPYFDRQSAFIAVSTGYPLLPVMVNLVMGKNLSEIKLPSNFTSNTALLEPVMDHIVTRFPVFSFGEFEAAWVVTDHRLNTIQKSVGATIGVGRSVEEALEKALRAAHFNSRDFSPTIMNTLSEDDLIERIIHPRDNRILVLMEALRRGYTVDELAEMTKINPFYFYKLQRIMRIEEDVAAKPWDTDVLREAKYYGLSDGLMAKLWDEEYESIRRFRWDHNILPTFKAFDPSAGEFDENNPHFYSTFETENETSRLSQNSALVVGTGAFRLGDGAAGSYTMAMISSELRRLEIPTIVMNNNPNDLLFIPQIADKHYYEPLELSDVMSILEVENPQYVFIPGNRVKLITKLRDMGVAVNVIAKDKYLPTSLSENQEQIIVNYFWDGTSLTPISMAQQDNDQIISDQKVMTQSLYESLPRPTLNVAHPGLYQLVVDHWPFEQEVQSTDLRPMPFTHLAFLNKISGVNWIRMMVRYMMGQVTVADRELIKNWRIQSWAIPAGRLSYSNPDFKSHLRIKESQIDNGQFAMGARMNKIEND